MKFLACVSTPGVTEAPCPTGQSLMLVDPIGFELSAQEASTITGAFAFGVVAFYCMGKGVGVIITLIKRG